MRVDAHMHVNYEGYTSDDVVRYLDRHKFDLCWLLTWEETNPQGWPYQHVSVEEIYETYLKYPSRIIPMYAPDPHRDDAPERLRAWFAKGIRGCAELKATVNWQSEKARRLLTAASELRLPVLFHMEERRDLVLPLASDGSFENALANVMNSDRLYGWRKWIFDVLIAGFLPLRRWRENRTIRFPGYMLDLASLAGVLSEFPSLQVIGHGPLFWKHISADATIGRPAYPTGPVLEGGLVERFLEQFDNLHADLSASGFYAMNRDHKYAQRFIEKFHGKLLFGSDNIETGLQDLLGSLKLSIGARRKVWGENAAKLVAEPGPSQCDAKIAPKSLAD